MKIKRRRSRGLLSKNRATGRSKKKVKAGPTGWLRPNWDSTKSGKYNYEQLGILRDPDEKLSTTFNKDAFSELVQNSEYVPTINTLQDWQKEILSVLIRKHGDDCKAMSKDIKINSWQWTKAQIKRMINLLEIS